MCFSYTASAPVFVPNPVRVIATLGKDVSLECKPRASPKPRITWKRGDRRIQPNKRYSSSLEASCFALKQRYLSFLHTGYLVLILSVRMYCTNSTLRYQLYVVVCIPKLTGIQFSSQGHLSSAGVQTLIQPKVGSPFQHMFIITHGEFIATYCMLWHSALFKI